MIDTLSWESLRYSYDDKSAISFPNGTVKRGEILAAIGPSGSGKSTWLQLLSGILKIQQGDVFYGSQKLSGTSERERDRLRSEHVGLVFQNNHFVKDLSVGDNLMLPSYAKSSKPELSFISDLAERLQVAHRIDAMPRECSVGELQRLSIIRTLSTKPSFILADEPTSALDDVNTSEILDTFEMLASEFGVGILVVTHDNRVKQRFANSISFGV